MINRSERRNGRGVGAIIAVGMCLLSLVSQADAKTLLWDRNTESDMKEYRVYLCLTAGCTAIKGPTPTATVTQPAAGVIPSWILPVNSIGAAVVTAVDVDGNESGASNMVPFETMAPAAPSNARTQ